MAATGSADDSGPVAATVQVVRRSLPALVVTTAMAYLSALVAAVMAGNLGRALIEVEVALFAERDQVPTWLGMLAIAQSLLLLGIVVLGAGAAFLAGVVEVTRSSRAGEDVRPWTPFRRGLPRAAAIGRALLVVAPLLTVSAAAAVLLLLLSIITLPLTLVLGAVALVRPSWRTHRLHTLAVVAAPLGVLLASVVRWGLWLPAVVVEGSGARAALRTSRRLVDGRWWVTARPFAAVVGVVILLAAAARALAGVGAPTIAVGVTGLAAIACLVVGWTVLATLLHEDRTDLTPPRRDREPTLFLGARPSPAIVGAVVLGLLGQGLWLADSATPASASTAPVTAATILVDTLADDLAGDCTTPGASCSLRAAVALAASASQPGAVPVIGFAVDGTIELTEALVIPSALEIDGAGQHVTLRNVAGGSAVVVGGAGGGEGGGGEGGGESGGGGESSGPLVVTLRDLTVEGNPTGQAAGLHVAAGSVTLDRTTFIGHHNTEEYAGSAIFNGASLTVTNSTFVGNASPTTGAGATIGSFGWVQVVNSTFEDNHGGGVAVWGAGSGLVANSALRGAMGGFNCSNGGALAFSGNISNDASCAAPEEPERKNVPALEFGFGVLGDHGGSVATVPVAASSVAVAAADSAYCPTVDARGQVRPIPPTPCDAGAFQTTTGTTTTVTAGSGSAAFGAPVAVTIAVQHPHEVPTGAVELVVDDRAAVVAGLVGGTAVVPVADLSVGAHSVTATYVPDGDLSASTGALQLAILQQESTTSLQVDPAGGSSALGVPVTLTATVRNAHDISAAAPTGTVSFRSGGDEVATAEIVDGVAVATGVLLHGGLHALAAQYDGDVGFTGSTSASVAHAVQSGTDVVLAGPSSITYGAPLSFDVSVAAIGAGGPVATGVVDLVARTADGLDSRSLGWSTLEDGRATIDATHRLAPGEYDITAAYRGDDDHEAAASAATRLSVLAAATDLTLTGPGAPTVAGEPARFTATITAEGTPADPAGQVQLLVDGRVLATSTLVDGSAVLVTVDLAVAAEPQVVTAAFVPDVGFLASTSTGLEHQVVRSSTTTHLTAPASSVAGEALELVAEVSPVAPAVATPAGSVRFTADGVTLGVVALADGTAVLEVSDLDIGEVAVSASFLETTEREGSTSLDVLHQVRRASTSVRLESSLAAPVHGQGLVLTATVAVEAPGSGIPTGTVTFTDGGTELGRADVVDGVASLPVLQLPAGDRELEAAYEGDARFRASDGALELSVAKPMPVVTITSITPSPSPWGAEVTVTATVVSPTGSDPTGRVELAWGSSGNIVGESQLVDGTATFAVDTLFGDSVLFARYLGDDDHHEAYSATDGSLAVRHRVVPTTYPIEVTTEVTPTVFGERIRVHADVEQIGGRVPSGTVQIRIQHLGTRATTFDASGRATADFHPTRVGTHDVYVTVAADPWFAEGAGQLLGHQVDPAPSTVMLVDPPATATIGAPVTLVARIDPAATAGVGSVRFFAGDVALGDSFPVGLSGLAGGSVVFPSAGVQQLSAVYDGGPGFFVPATSPAIDVGVSGRPLSFGPLGWSFSYGSPARLDVALYSTAAGAPAATGTIEVLHDGAVVGRAGLVPDAGTAPMIVRASVDLGRDMEPGTYPLTVSYGGDASYGATEAAASMHVSRRQPEIELDQPVGQVRVGEDVVLTGRLVVPPGMPLAPTGQLVLGSGETWCVVPLVDGRLGGSCTVRFDRANPTEVLRARYAGDDRYLDQASEARTLAVRTNVASIDLQVSVPPAGTWTDAEPVQVSWSVAGDAQPAPTGLVAVVTSEGLVACPVGPVGSCQVRFSTPSDGAWIEVQYRGDSRFAAVSRRVLGRVTGCYSVTAGSGATVVTPPNCAGTRFLGGTDVHLTAADRAGYRFAGWTTSHGDAFLQQSPVPVHRSLLATPRYEPLCVTLRTEVSPSTLPRITPDPAPNCDDRTAHDGTPRDLAAIAAAEVQSGSMRYRVGTVVRLRNESILLANGASAPMQWSGDGLAADGTLLMDRDREAWMTLQVPCRRFVVDGPPGSSVSVASSAYDVGTSVLLSRYTSGRCSMPDGSPGYIPGTSLRITMQAPAGMWFERFGTVERLTSHRAPTSVTQVSERPDGTAAAGSTTVVVPDHDAALSGFAAGVVCHEVQVTAQDAVAPESLRSGSVPASVTSTAPNCPSWWLREHGIAAGGTQRWYLAGTAVTLTADTTVRLGFVNEFTAAKQIFFHRWTGAVTGSSAVQTVVVDGTVAATAQWYVGAQCVPVIVNTKPAGVGEVIVSDLGDRCPQQATSLGSTRPQAPLGHPLSLAARPIGTLQTIWTVEGTSVSKTEACAARESEIESQYADGYESGRSDADTERILMQQGYLPGLVAAQIQEEAAWRFERGYTQAQIVADLTTLGLLDVNGAAAPDRLRENPCETRHQSTVLPAGQRVLSTTVDGSMAYTAWSCQAVVPSVTVVALDGTRSQASGALLDRFGPVFRSSSSAGNCPTPGWFLPGTTAVLGSDGTGAPGYAIDGWALDGVQHPAGPLSVPITATGTPREVDLVVRVRCHKLTINAEFGSTAYPLPNCPGQPASAKLYAEGTSVTVTAGQSSSHVFQGWGTAGGFNPILAQMDAPVTLTASFRSKSVGETIMDSVIDPALDAMGVAAKKTVGGIAYVTRVVAQTLIDDVFLSTLSSIGDGLLAGFGALGVEGQVLDGIVLGLQAPSNAFAAGLAGFECVEQWAWGRTMPTLDDLKTAATSVVAGEAAKTVQGVEVAEVVAAAEGYLARIEAGDPAALAEVYMLASGGAAGAMTLALVEDISAHPDRWEDRATAMGELALAFLEDQFGKPFTWETSASEAWSTGGDAFLSCMADNGRSIVGA